MMNTEKEKFERKQEIFASCVQKRRERCPEFDVSLKNGDFESAFHQLCENMEIRLNRESFVYFFDFGFQFDTSIQNITPNYEIILKSGMQSLLYPAVPGADESVAASEKFSTGSDWETKEKDDQEGARIKFCAAYNSVVQDLMLLSGRIQKELELQKPENYEQKIEWFRNMADRPAESFREAMQRILFINQLLWQTGSHLVGLGRLDSLLGSFYEKDMQSSRLTKEQTLLEIKAFLRILHEYYWFKSSALMGDTGQIITLGGLESDGDYICNDLTCLFLQAVTELNFSDPKLILRVSKNMPKELMHAAVDCMKTGNGSPLLSNDEVIIPCLKNFGVEEKDAYQYATSACWEPLIAGKSSSMNNQGGLPYLKALKSMLIEERLDRIPSFEVCKEKYLSYLKYEVRECLHHLKKQRYKRNTLYSVFIEGCRESKKDIVDGGAVYHNIGMTTVGLGNTVNALLNIKELVFEKKQYSLVDVKVMSVLDFEGQEETADVLKISRYRYGKDDRVTLELTNQILRFVTEQTKDFRTDIGGRVKFGVSSPDYITNDSRNTASFDGHRKGEPLMVHISNETAQSYTELMNFAAGLDYQENRFNGNVVDFMVNPSFIEQHQEKFEALLLGGVEAGFFQLQTNVIGSETLLQAKAEPEKFAGLIVRVWGFSAYFVELPESYQDMLIKRALLSEGKIA